MYKFNKPRGLVDSYYSRCLHSFSKCINEKIKTLGADQMIRGGGAMVFVEKKKRLFSKE